MQRIRDCGVRPLSIGIALCALLLALLTGCQETDPQGSKRYETPEAAVEALLDALGKDDADALVAIFGRAYEPHIVTPDWEAERAARQKIFEAAKETHELSEIADGEVDLIVGTEQWPFPIPIVRDDGAWHFDTEEGIEVIIDRRIGRNELAAIAVASAYVDAQIDYARYDRDGDDVLEYAQRLASSPGQRDGLYWEAGPDEDPSPFGPLVQGAERYLETKQPGDPLKGYFFQILTRQGPNPPGRAYDYVINGNMIAGFALVAYPADYGNSGVMTFLVNHRGVVQQKDLGEFPGMDAYDPDDTWSEIED